MVEHSKEKFGVYLKWIKEIIQRIQKYTKGYDYKDFSHDQKTIDATLMMLVQLGETAMQIEHHYPKSGLVSTKSLKAMRNFLVHAYHKIDTKIIRDTLEHDIPSLWREIQEVAK